MTTFTPPLWSLTAAQLDFYPSLVTMDGTKFSPKNDLNHALYLWRGDVDRALMLKLPIPDEVLVSRQRQARPIKSPALLNDKGKPFTWSFSALQDFEGCPKRYAHKRFYCDVVEEETEAQRWGTRVHTAGEDFVNGKPVTDPEAFAPVEKFARLFKSLGATPEVEVCLTENLEPVSWFDKRAWYRGKLDVVVKTPEKISYFDYKTGKRKDDYGQLEVCLAMLSLIEREVETFAGKYLWIKDNSVSGIDALSRNDLKIILEKTLGKVERMKQAWVSETFNAKPSGLCPWCPANAGCKYKRGGK